MTHICAPPPPPHPHSAPPRSLHRFSPPPAARGARAGLHSRDMRNCSWRHFHTSLLRHVVYGGAPTALGAAGVSPYEKFMPRYTLTAAVAGSASTTFHDRPTDHFVYAPTLEPLNTAFTLYSRLYNRLSSRLYDRLQSVNGRLLTSLSLSLSFFTVVIADLQCKS